MRLAFAGVVVLACLAGVAVYRGIPREHVERARATLDYADSYIYRIEGLYDLEELGDLTEYHPISEILHVVVKSHDETKEASFVIGRGGYVREHKHQSRVTAYSLVN